MIANNWLAGTLELTSKVRYGLTSRGAPIFRFIPYDKRFPPMAVGCSQRDLFYNIHAIVEPTNQPTRAGELAKATIVQNLGQPSAESELQLLLATYAHDSLKELRPAKTSQQMQQQMALVTPYQHKREFIHGFTFHIDPRGCKDVDDSFTVFYNHEKAFWSVAINIADVSEFVSEGSSLDALASKRATSFYTPSGDAIQPMFARELSEAAFTLLPSAEPKAEPEAKPTLSLVFDLNPQPTNIRWVLSETQTTTSYTYEEAQASLQEIPELQVIARAASALAENLVTDTHAIVERLMIFYNLEAGKMLSAAGVGILRRHKTGEAKLQIPGIPEFLAYEAAEFCLPTAEDTSHEGLGSEAYAYASSPIRRYADLVNQRAIKSLLHNVQPIPVSQELVDDLNRRQKQAKAFQRDLFFMTTLAAQPNGILKGIVMEINEEKRKAKIWVPGWNTAIKAKSLELMDFAPGQEVSIQWYEDRGAARWKEKIVFKLK
jgi:exoribonuclease R